MDAQIIATRDETRISTGVALIFRAAKLSEAPTPFDVGTLS